jgi:iron complex transport system permease protein
MRSTSSHPIMVSAAMIGALVVMFLATIALGSVTIPPGQVVRSLIGRDVSDPVWDTIVWSVRLPRATTAALAGAAMGVAGLTMQTLFRNPLADPFVLGVSSGAGLGVAVLVLGTGTAAASSGVLAEARGLGAFGVAGAGALGAAVVMVIVLAVARWVDGRLTLLIVGLMTGYVAGGIVQVLLASASDSALRAYSSWGLGSFRGTTWEELVILGPAVGLGVALVASLVKPLDALLLGDRYAASMGVPIARVRMTCVGAAAILAGTVTAFCGPIGFLGIAVPHVARLVLGEGNHRRLLPSVAILGATIALAGELIAQLPGSERTLPVNAIFALLGAPVVIVVLLRGRQTMELGS